MTAIFRARWGGASASLSRGGGASASASLLLIVSLAMLVLCPMAHAVTSIAELKLSSPNTPVTLSGVIVTASYYDADGRGGYARSCFAVENSDRSNGVRIVSAAAVNAGDIVTVSGTTNTINGEWVVVASSVSVNSSGNQVPLPLGMTNHASSGDGLNGMGLLVKLSGKVTRSVDTGDYSGHFYIDDGSGLQDGSGYSGLRCRPALASNGITASALPAVGDYVSVTGVVGAQSAGGAGSRYFWTKSIAIISAAPEPSVPVEWRQFQFGTSTDVWGFSHQFVTDLSGLASPAAENEYSISMTDFSTCITVTGLGKTWGGYCDAGSIGSFQSQLRFYGGEVIKFTYSFRTGGRNKSILYLQYYGGERIVIASGSTLIADGLSHTYSFTMPASSIGKTLSAFIINLQNPVVAGTTLCLMDFALVRDPSISTRINADAILATPPIHDARVKPWNGLLAMTVDNAPITGWGWSCIIDQNISGTEMANVIGGTGMSCSRVNFTLGEQCYLRPNFYAPTWIGPNLFDWSYLDGIVAKFIDANPQQKLILCVCLDGALWWTRMHPEAAGIQANIGVPDYLSPEWRRDSRDAIRQMVAHIQTSSYAGAVIGYELFNGATLDCNFEVNDSSPRALERFRAGLQVKYGTVAALRSAWGDPAASFDNAVPEQFFNDNYVYSTADQWQMLQQPGDRPRYQDSVAFRNHVFQQVILNFAADIKEATHGRALVGARTGNFMGQGPWLWSGGYQESDPIDELLRSPDFDFFDIQECYFGRTHDGKTGSGVPVLPPLALAGFNKMIAIQNDWRTHTGSDYGYGATENVQQTIQVQRRVLANCIVMGMTEYLWQMSYSYNDPVLIADMQKYESIMHKSYYTDRGNNAQLAFVFDEGYKKYFGYNPDPYYWTPSKGVAFFDEMKYTWARAGVPFDMIFLDQLQTAKPYKVYVFVHTIGLTDAQINMIHSVVGKTGNVGIFMWVDGLMDGQRVNASRMTTLTGINLTMQTTSRTWQMSPTSWSMSNLGVSSEALMGTLADYDGGVTELMAYYPSFVVNDSFTTGIATYDGTPYTGIAKKEIAGFTSIYSDSCNIVPPLMRYALNRAGVFQYTNTDDICYINNSFVGLHPKTTGNITVTLPSSSALYDVFTDQEMPAATSFSVPVIAGNTYLYYRGTRAQWQTLGQ